MLAKKARAMHLEETIHRLCENLSFIFSKIDELRKERQRTEEEIKECGNCYRFTKEDTEASLKKLDKDNDLSEELCARLKSEIMELELAQEEGKNDRHNEDDGTIEGDIALLERKLNDCLDKNDLLKKEKEFILREINLLRPSQEEGNSKIEALDEEMEKILAESSAVNKRLQRLLQEYKENKSQSETNSESLQAASKKLEEDNKALRILISKNRETNDTLQAVQRENKLIEKELKSNKLEALLKTNLNLEATLKSKAKTLSSFERLVEENEEKYLENEELRMLIANLKAACKSSE
jgi:chromosome segregation ATPase